NFRNELSRPSKENKQSISENSSTLLLLEEDRCISKNKTSIPEQDKTTTTINARLFPIIEQDESNATDVYPIRIVDDALILRQNECNINLQIK
ncbi:14893_t:CDS:2, partial [Gigaspora rosea]